MTPDFPNTAILGGGLIGGSIALALEGSSRPARLWVRRRETCAQALARGISGATTDLCEAVSGADLLILATPVEAMPDLLEQALRHPVATGCLITDVGSVKRAPHRDLAPIVATRRAIFLGSHPMAGSEKTGIDAAAVDLFSGAACILTDAGNADAFVRARLESFWNSLGCRTRWMTPEAHDRLLARLSHLPHLAAAAVARACIRGAEDAATAAGGLRDTTRVAAGDPAMWARIALENRDALAPGLRQTIEELGKILAALESVDEEAARHWLGEARGLRRLLDPS
jgi:prephenate dehydrogenase